MIGYEKIRKNKSLQKSPKTVVLSTRIEELQMAALEMIAKKNYNVSASQLIKVLVEEFLASAFENMETIHIDGAIEVLSKYEDWENMDRYDDSDRTPMGIRGRLEALYKSELFNENKEIELGYIFKDSLKFEKDEKMLSIINDYDEMIFPKNFIEDFKLN